MAYFYCIFSPSQSFLLKICILHTFDRTTITPLTWLHRDSARCCRISPQPRRASLPCELLHCPGINTVPSQWHTNVCYSPELRSTRTILLSPWPSEHP